VALGMKKKGEVVGLQKVTYRLRGVEKKNLRRKWVGESDQEAVGGGGVG